MDLKAQLPVLIRYLVAIVASALAGRGLIPAEQVPTFIDQTVAFTLAFIAFLPMIYALIRRPSSKALEVAKQVDARIPPGASAVVRTPSGQPDIIVHPK